jgi:hypothetical protein
MSYLNNLPGSFFSGIPTFLKIIRSILTCTADRQTTRADFLFWKCSVHQLLQGPWIQFILLKNTMHAIFTLVNIAYALILFEIILPALFTNVIVQLLKRSLIEKKIYSFILCWLYSRRSTYRWQGMRLSLWTIMLLGTSINKILHNPAIFF